ncbi:MAG: N-acetyltransferase family protein [Alphaproteobacteria bacterium]
MDNDQNPPPRTIDVRDAEPADLAAVQAIYAAHVLNGVASLEEVPPTLDEIATRRAAVLALGLPYLVAWQDGAVRGFAYAGTYRARSAYRHTVEDSVYVAPGFAGKGIGRALLGRLIQSCARSGMRQMVAIIGDSANEASVTMHRRLGFTMVGNLQSVGFKHGRWVDTIIMQRALDPEADA